VGNNLKKVMLNPPQLLTIIPKSIRRMTPRIPAITAITFTSGRPLTISTVVGTAGVVE